MFLWQECSFWQNSSCRNLFHCYSRPHKAAASLIPQKLQTSVSFSLWCSTDLLYYNVILHNTQLPYKRTKAVQSFSCTMNEQTWPYISADFWKPLPWHPNITELTFEGVTTHSLNLKLASTLIVLLFEVDTDIYLFYFKSDSKSYGLPISERQ